MVRTTYVPALVLITLLTASACTNGSGAVAAEPVDVTHEQAVDVLHRIVARAPAGGAEEFCEVTLQRQSCEDAWAGSVAERCLKPGDMPRVIRSAAVPEKETKTGTWDGGRVLLIEGRTAGGGRYVSEFFVTGSEGRPTASLGVYWSGIGLGNSPLGEGVTVLPEPECAQDAGHTGNNAATPPRGGGGGGGGGPARGGHVRGPPDSGGRGGGGPAAARTLEAR
ncbi:hypothetical protein [Streptomyces sp. N35]|uniref:hypothetical protein n=1 Tax=Streptomyces sp. N35 TaxID=2795730 RepID=UPI0018F56A7E|nr:hypothetical protein [Streptomyces sp. N35]